jgi:hypothetical protein
MRELSFALLIRCPLLQLSGQKLKPDGNVSLTTTQLQPAPFQTCTQTELISSSVDVYISQSPPPKLHI